MNSKVAVKFIDWKGYISKFEELLNQPSPEPPYDNKDYFNYLKLNYNRQNRWLKKGEVIDKLKEKIKQINYFQKWIIITEPWCGDAAHSIAFIKLITELNENIELKFVWRDQPPYLIEDYLTNGGKAVPKLIIRNKAGDDLSTWGPRPQPCQELFHQLREEKADFEKLKVELQNWYNKDKGKTLQDEFLDLLQDIKYSNFN